MTIGSHQHFVALFDDADHARAAVRTLEQRGIDIHDARIGDERDRLSAVAGEMRSETTRTAAGGVNVGPLTPEMGGGALVGAVIGGLIGLVVALPFATIGFGSMVLWARLLTMAIVGLVVGSTIGAVVGGGFAAGRGEEPIAAETGVTVALPLSNEAAQVLASSGALRIDIVAADGHPVSTVLEEPSGIAHLAHETGRNFRNERGVN